MPRLLPTRSASAWLLFAAGLFALVTFGLSWWRWHTFQYATFDLAFYVQVLWLTLHGKSTASLLGVSLLGNHAEPIVYLALPLFALIRHPMLLPALQVAALATMPFTAFRIARRLGLAEGASLLLALATLLAPASGFVAVHEFHPEALSAPLLLLLYEAQIARRWRAFALWFLLTLACKENLALLLLAWCSVHAFLERGRGRAELWRWYGWPALTSLGWLLLYGAVLSPWLNGGRVDYWNLYSALGNSPGDAVRKFFTEPHRAWGALSHAVVTGNLVWASLLSTAGLALLRPRWLLIALPILLQHLLSWRASEWSIAYHYAAPLVPVLWLAAAEACARWSAWRGLSWAPVAACVAMQACIGLPREMADEVRRWPETLWARSLRAPLVEHLAKDPAVSVVAGLPYLSHLAERERIHSLHLILKGTQTLSFRPYEPDFEADAVLIDGSDDATFSKFAGYYHPEGQVEGRRLLSSDELLLRFLAPKPLRGEWARQQSVNEVTLLERVFPSIQAGPTTAGFELVPGTRLLSARLQEAPRGADFMVALEWVFTSPRRSLPWMRLELAGPSTAVIPLGMAVPGAGGDSPKDGERQMRTITEARLVNLPPWIKPGIYSARLVIYDQVRALWRPQTDAVLGSTELGHVRAGP